MDYASVELRFVHVGDGGLGISLGEVKDVGGPAVRAGCIRRVVSRVVREAESQLRFGSHCLLTGRSRSSMSPYWPKISYRCSSLTFLVRRSTTICEDPS